MHISEGGILAKSLEDYFSSITIGREAFMARLQEDVERLKVNAIKAQQ